MQNEKLQTSVPNKLPVVEDKTFLTHTMEEDVLRAKGQEGSMPQKPAGAEPFTAHIPPPVPPAPPTLENDPFREKVEMPMPPTFDRDQPVELPGTNAGEQQQQEFQVHIPQRQSRFSPTTIILAAVLIALVGAGAAGYWWFFIRSEPAPVVQEIPQPPVPEPPIIPKPIVEPVPEPEPIPAPIPTPEPAPEPEPAPPIPVPEPTPEPEPIPPPAPPEIPEPVVPDAIVALDKTVIISTDIKADTIASAIQEENKKIIEQTVTIRYLIKLSTDTEKRFLDGKEVVQMLGLHVPTSFWNTIDRLEVVGYKNAGTFRYGFIAQSKDKAAMQSLAASWEPTMVDDLTTLYINKQYVKPAQMAFSENTYLDFSKRYINMPQPDVSLDYAVSNAYFIVATSKAMIYALLDETRPAK
ncbi:MAG: hypothetical protein AAB581_04000 [Patescibacteria group bacterium]